MTSDNPTPPLEDWWLNLYRDASNSCKEDNQPSIWDVLDLAAGHDPTDFTVLDDGGGVRPQIVESHSPVFHVTQLVAALCDEVLRLRAGGAS